ncbi:SDR family NAD(P)-dependent oxidoreductase [Paenibacillus radicis (ex Gao et al. 2016)]|uniref:Short-chain dehydrogenase n=1 Tax=Paenibacillus radicis (ex Gao et al. 2016) TaxID=1737354 RepID=A0A917M170_9BACL|nr:SDR family NAD(P)-dependent oxidoreductase [Paenibacillus radicis (ex Gao et al. 2016)]GGG70079.1 short-chain dehydrogenase [Paenibacillus radicis (ex Gao et al. 2016)]
MTTTSDLTGKVAFVTGGTRGIGLETVRSLAKLGATVIIGARDPQKGNEIAQQFKQDGFNVESIKIDVNVHQDNVAAYQYLDENYGKLDILINNAGVLLDQENVSIEVVNRTSTLSSAILRDTFDANFFAQIDLTQILLPLIRKSDAGRIVNLSSILGSLSLHADPASPIYGMKTFAYNASKAALNAFTIHLAAELRDTTIKVNSIHPGWVRTRLGGGAADIDEVEGSRTSILAATLPEDGPTGSFFFEENALPW